VNRAFCAISLLLLLLLMGSSGVCAAKAADASWLSLVPGAERIGMVTGEPPAAPVFRGDALIGFVFSTQAVVRSTGFSGKPLDVAVGIDTDGRITGARVIEQHEPILTIGVKPEDIDAFLARYVGRSIEEPIRVVRRNVGAGEVEAIAGATVSSLVLNNAILTAARAVASSRGLVSSGTLDLASFEPLGFRQLVADHSIVQHSWTVAEIDAQLAAEQAAVFPPGDPDDLFAELAAALATPPRVGRNLLGDRLYERILGELELGDQLIVVAGRGRWSFKGTEWRRSGIFDRIRLLQGSRSFTLRADQHRSLERLAAADAPAFRELALFVLPRASGFDPLRPWRLQLRVDGRTASGETVATTVDLAYQLPARYVRDAPASAGPALWPEVWRQRWLDIAVLTAAVLLLTSVLFAQERLARRRRALGAIRTGFLLFALFWIGWYAGAQLSVIHVLTFSHALLTGFRWDVFLLEPLIFVLWSYVAIVLLFWGRGVYCGWLCPFGALQELLNALARRLRVPQLEMPFNLHEGLRSLKFVLFLAIFALSLGSMESAQMLAEVEPFKTAIVLRLIRNWPYLLYALALLFAGLFIRRLFCRYLCPLGAALAIPARLRQFEWLRRRRQCGTECRICQVQCPVGAIQPEGHIHPGECIYCLRCQANYSDERVCPPLIQRRQRRERGEAAIGRPGESPA
jgi:transcriptional regulator of nitric oxide reductase